MKKHKRGITQVQGIIQEKPNNKNKKKAKKKKARGNRIIFLINLIFNLDNRSEKELDKWDTEITVNQLNRNLRNSSSASVEIKTWPLEFFEKLWKHEIEIWEPIKHDKIHGCFQTFNKWTSATDASTFFYEKKMLKFKIFFFFFCGKFSRFHLLYEQIKFTERLLRVFFFSLKC